MSNRVVLDLSPFDAGSPVAADVCRVSGYLIGADGRPLAGWRLFFTHQFDPLISGSDTLVLMQDYAAVTDENGFLSFDFLQGAKLLMHMVGRYWDLTREVNIPASATADLIDVLFPYPVSYAFEDGASVSKALASGDFALPLVATFSDGTTDDNAAQHATFSVADGTLLTNIGQGMFTPLRTGTTTVSVTAVDADGFALSQDVGGNPISRTGTPTATLPSAITVTVT